jgi:hypothetical protein
MSDEEPGGPGAGPRPSAGSPEPGELLGELAAVRRRTRSARHAYWFPLVLFGLLIGASAPLYVSAAEPRFAIYIGSAGSAVRGGLPAFGGLSLLGGSLVAGSSFYIGWYWLVALVGGYLLTLLWYRWHARRVGVQTPARGYLITGVVLTVLAVLLPPLSRLVPPLGWLWPGDLWIRGTFAFLIIAAGLWVLARAERSLALVITAAVYTGVALLASLYNVENILFRLGWNPRGDDVSLTVLPSVLLPAVVLMAAGAAAFVAQRPKHPARPA